MPIWVVEPEELISAKMDWIEYGVDKITILEMYVHEDPMVDAIVQQWLSEVSSRFGGKPLIFIDGGTWKSEVEEFYDCSCKARI
jgi:hypothetical protein